MRTKILSLLALLALSSCAGNLARANLLMPVLAKAWSQEISQHIEKAIELDALPENVSAAAARAQSTAMLTALKSGDRNQVITVDWAMLRLAALAGINAEIVAGTLGPNNAKSLIETVDQFDRKRTQLLSR